MFEDLGPGDDPNSHWVTTPPSPRGPREDFHTNARMAAFGSSPNNFDPAISRPGNTRTTSPDSPRQASVSISHKQRGSLSSNEVQHCDVCDVDLSGIEPARQHYAGKPHKRAIEKALIEAKAKEGKEEKVSLRCDVCVKGFSSEISANQHYKSKGHLTAVEGAKRWASTQGVSSPSRSGENPAVENQPSFLKPYTLFPDGYAEIGGGMGRVLKEEAKVTRQDTGAVAVSPADSTEGNLNILGRGGQGPPMMPEAFPGTQVMPGVTPGLPLAAGVPPGFPMLSGMSQEDKETLKRRVTDFCAASLEQRMREIIPQISNQIADMLLESLGSSIRSGGRSGPEDSPTAAGRDGGPLTDVTKGTPRAGPSPNTQRVSVVPPTKFSTTQSHVLPTNISISLPGSAGTESSILSVPGSLKSRPEQNDLSKIP